MFKKIAFIHYDTQNLERALTFYRDILGLPLLVQNEEWIEFDVGGQRLALRQVDSSPSPTSGTGSAGAMIWLETPAMARALSHLDKNNINLINDLQEFSYGKMAIFEDPDGNP
ncbi:MAG: hypothetical protein GWM98_07910, partial [Nitrospinaceae bacterium]|nr:hypothetical protein [Nitrospinaceae bacterium]NIR54438.1 hypothetical protein [Nitrospinaceae bacterium]NIT81660.1 hypothetical protein [Nitrospinaceae bacterium]NIU43937.1 hypothetical protein [Nitrospinaceae bacterium]NIW05528.1 hypothetical protein [Nitrospinaceae bacterium]